MKQSDFYGSVYSTAKELGATDTQAHLAASQASLETGYGQHVVGNNYFGVKASPSYTGPTVTANTSEGEDAVSNRMDQSFRAYDGLKSSVANYMDVMSNAFPDAWNATNIADAAKGLVSGKFGRYAKDINYPGKIQSIANKLGAQQKYAYAQDPQNVPVPFSPEESPYANSQQAQAIDGLSGVVNPISPQAVTPGEWGVINGVAPVLGPTVEGWSAMASANPVQAPIGGDLMSANPVPTSIETGFSTPNISQADISRALSNVTTRNEFDPSFTAGLMGPSNPVVPTSVETTSYTPQNTVPNVAEAVAPTGTLDSFASALAAQRQQFGTLGTGIYSPEHINGVQAQAEKQLAASRAVPSGLMSSYAAPTSVTPAERAISSISPISMPGMVQNVQQQMQVGQQQALAAPNFQQALNPSLPAMNNPWAPTQIVADPSIMSPDQVQSLAASLQSSPPTGFTSQTPAALGSFPSALAAQREVPGYHLSELDGVTMVPNAIETAPALDTVGISEQPTIQGPATTPAVSQQTQQAVTQQAARPAQSLSSRLSSAMNPGTVIGGALGGATLGPIGGFLGALLGNSINNGGLSGMSGMFGNQAPVGTNYGFNPGVVAGIYGGGYAPGTSAIASDGSRVSAQGGGDTARTNSFGVTDVENSYGGYSGDFSGWY